MNGDYLDPEKLIEITDQIYDGDKTQETWWNVYMGSPEDEHLVLPYPDCTYGIDRPLLQIEKDFATNRHAWPRVRGKDEKEVILVLLIGTSFEPLLQSIWAYRPIKVLPVLNKYYHAAKKVLDFEPNQYTPGNEHWNAFKTKMERLPKNVYNKIDKQWLNEAPDFQVEDSPINVFEFLQKNLARLQYDKQYDIIVDITGAKKSMVAGAYLYAAYSGAKISYVDFEIYHQIKNRPYGFTSKIELLPNPFNEFALQLWEQIRLLFEQYGFGAGLALLANLPSKAINHVTALYQYFADDTAKKSARTIHEQLKDYFRILRDWESGELAEAKQLAESFAKERDCTFPAVIFELGDLWPTSDTTTVDNNAHKKAAKFLSDPKLVTLYAYDELERARWYIGEPQIRAIKSKINPHPQYRLAFAKAYALYETLFKARLLFSYFKGHLKFKLPGESDYKEITELETTRYHEIFVALMLKGYQFMTKDVCIILKNGNYRFEHDDCQIHLSVENYCKFENNDARELLPIRGANHDVLELRDKRNDITHSYFPVNKEWAQNAINLAQKNLNHYKDKWLPACNFDTTVLTGIDRKEACNVLSWDEVKKVFGLEFLIAPQ
jgi:hypothetical protein